MLAKYCPKHTCDICGKKDKFSQESEKCIFHCAKTAKNGWYEQNGEKKIWNEEFVQDFWDKIRTEKMAKPDYDFSRFIFPEFEDITSNLKESGSKTIKLSDGREKTIIIYRIYKSGNFWKPSIAFLFNSEMNFGYAKFLGEANFRDIEFRGKTNFRATEFFEKANFMNAKFSEEVDFWCTNFSEEADFSHANFSHTYVTLFEETKFQSFQEGKQKIPSAFFRNIDFPETVKFRQTDLSRVSFLDSNLEKARFDYCSWGYLKPSVDEHGNPEFQKYESRNILWDEWVKEEKKDFAKVENLNRQLKKNFEEKKDYETAGDFHLGEMAMRRQKFRQEREKKIEATNKKVSWLKNLFFLLKMQLIRISDSRIWNWLFFNNAKLFLLFWYWLFSDYGERPGRVFCWLFILIFVFTGLYFFTTDFNLGNSFELAFQSFVPLFTGRVEIENFSGYTKAIFYFEVLLSTILWFLLLLAIRRKFRR